MHGCCKRRRYYHFVAYRSITRIWCHQLNMLKIYFISAMNLYCKYGNSEIILHLLSIIKNGYHVLFCFVLFVCLFVFLWFIQRIFFKYYYTIYTCHLSTEENFIFCICYLLNISLLPVLSYTFLQHYYGACRERFINFVIYWKMPLTSYLLSYLIAWR